MAKPFRRLKVLGKGLRVWAVLLRERFKRFMVPSLRGVPVVDVFRYFFRGIVNGAITTWASAVAFSFFLATVPLLIFIFTLIPYLR